MAIEEIKKGIYTNVEYNPSNVTCIDTGDGLILVDTPTMTSGFYKIDPEMLEETKMLLAASIPNLYSQIHT